MKYTKDNFIINLNFEILSLIQSISLKEASWINYNQTSYINMLKKELNLNLDEIKNLIVYFKDNNLQFHKLSTVVTAMDESYNLDINFLKQQGFDTKKIKEFEQLVKEMYSKIDIDKLFLKYKKFYMLKLDEIKNFLKNINLYDIYDFYGFKLGELNIVISFISGNFGIKYNKKIYCYKSFKLDENNNLILKATIIPFLYHEFSHPYINYILSKNTIKLSFLDNHYNLIFNEKLYPYSNKLNLLEEILVRANEVFLAKKYMSKKATEIYIKKQLNVGIFYFEELINLFENKFKEYDNYEQFFIKEIIPFYKNKFKK